MEPGKTLEPSPVQSGSPCGGSGDIGSTSSNLSWPGTGPQKRHFQNPSLWNVVESGHPQESRQWT